jgi:hypothetical protein
MWAEHGGGLLRITVGIVNIRKRKLRRAGASNFGFRAGMRRLRDTIQFKSARFRRRASSSRVHALPSQQR